MDQAVRFREILRRLAMIGERFAEDEADRPLATDERLARVTAPIVQEACE